VARFDDPTVGSVSGHVVLTGTPESLRSSEEVYYSIEWGLQEQASRVYSMCGVDGALHAFRRELFVHFPSDTLIEDFALCMGIVRLGYRVVYEPAAVGWEKGPDSLAEEFRRKVRIAAGAAQSLIRGTSLPSNAPASFWFIWISHKLLRWISPLALLAALVIAGLTWDHLASRVVIYCTAILAVLAFLRAVTGWSILVLNTPFYFLFGQMAAGWGLIKGLLGKQSVLWRKANR
jgi:cellulose synthase/poly-beta-1,6-N-acetylglucosamine synthase-like glycosyltransferase